MSEYKEERERARELLKTIVRWLGDDIEGEGLMFEDVGFSYDELDRFARFAKAYVPAQLALLNILKEEEQERSDER